MERYPKFMLGKLKVTKDIDVPQIKVQIHCNSKKCSKNFS